MKPIVIYLDKQNDEIKLTRKEFEEYINKAYDSGYDYGYIEGKKYYRQWYGNGNDILNIQYTTGKKSNLDCTEITCDSGEVYNTIGD